MALTLTYDGVLSRVRISATGIGSTADYAHIERSTNQIQWTTVRGAAAVPVVAGALERTVDDYEFAADVANFYRLTAVDTSPITFVAAGAAATGNNASVAPALPAGWVPGDLFTAWAGIRNSGVGTVNVPAGWTSMVDFGNVRLLGRRAVTGDTAPTITFAGGAANADTIAQCAAFRNAELIPAASATLLNGSAQNITYPALTVPGDNHAVIYAGWKQDDWTSVATIAGATEIGEPVSTAGDDAGMVWDRVIQTAAANIVSGAFAVTGGGAAISRGVVAALAPAAFLSQETDSVTPDLTSVWLKSIARPFLNRAVTVIDWSEIERPSRAGIFEVKGRSFPIAVSDVRGSRAWTLEVVTQTAADARDFDLVLASGDTLFVQTPDDCLVPGGYVCVETTSQRRSRPRGQRHIFALPMVEVAAPGPDVVGATYTCQGVLNDYATCADVLADNPTCADLLENISDANDVIVP